jgi:hypothetical protein
MTWFDSMMREEFGDLLEGSQLALGTGCEDEADSGDAV